MPINILIQDPGGRREDTFGFAQGRQKTIPKAHHPHFELKNDD